MDVSVYPEIEAAVTTGADGAYSFELPIGSYTVSFALDSYAPVDMAAPVVAAETTTLDVGLEPDAAVVVDAGADATSGADATLDLSVDVTAFDGSTITSYSWAQVGGEVDATLANETTDTVSVTFPDAEAYKEAYIELARLPKDRFMVVPVVPMQLEEATHATFTVTVVTSSGTYTDSVNVVIAANIVIALGIQNVPVDTPVFLQAAEGESSYSWTIDTAPTDSTAAFDDATSQFPIFVPDKTGEYVVSEATTGESMTLYAGRYMGAITAQDSDGNPVPGNCTTCHSGNLEFPQFAAWALSGHAEILQQNIDDAAGHWSLSCASCHSVGYDPAGDNGGFDEAVEDEGWEPPHPPGPGSWTTMLADYPDSASLANIQCENCHGPNGAGSAHTDGIENRVNLDSALCGTCHGEPARHGRYQQWQESGHGNYDLAQRGVLNSHCGRCHSTQGFLAWISQGDLTQRIQGADGNATDEELTALGMTADQIQPVTCVACHPPHNPGSITGEPNNAIVRIVDNTPLLPSGFSAVGVGRGAQCITCHNTRNGAHGDLFPLSSRSAPHTAAQGDVLLGLSAYFVNEGIRSPHSYIEDSCANCHMEQTPPPADLSYNLSGTNHDFAASPTICGNCHGDFNAEGLQAAFVSNLEVLNEVVAEVVINDFNDAGIVNLTAIDAAGATAAARNIDLSGDLDITEVLITEGHGQMEFDIVLSDTVDFDFSGTTVALDEFAVQLANVKTAGGTAIYPADSVMTRAVWNYLLLHADGSEGVHNPGFEFEVIDSTIQALEAEYLD